ncbi:MAG: hypothetical protein RIS80_1271, partial [Actinomycetota bacterium]
MSSMCALRIEKTVTTTYRKESASMSFSTNDGSRIRTNVGRGRTLLALLVGLLILGFMQPTASAEAVTSYRISFMANGGSGTMSSQVISSAGGTLKKNTFFRTGYTFLGWAKTTQGALAYLNSARIKPTASFKLYAKWSKIPVVLPTAPTVSGHTVGTLLWAEEFK